MDFPRTTFLTFLSEAIKERERYETCDLGFTRDSAMLAAMRELFKKVQEERVYDIHLKEDSKFSYEAELYRDRKGS